MGTVYAKDAGASITKTKTESDSQGSCDKGGAEQRTVDLQGISARVDRVCVDGLVRTKDDIVLETVKDLFSATNFEEVIRKAHSVRNKLDSLGCFRNIAIHIDTSDGEKATPNGYEVTFYVRELKRLLGGVHTMVGDNNEGSLVVGLRAPNILGRGERIQGEYSYGTKRTQIFNVALIKPLMTKYNATVSASVFQNDQEWPVSGYKLVEKGLLLDLSFFSLNKLKHSLQWAGDIREMLIGTRYASFEVREDAGPTLKSAVRHILSYDTRDTNIFPNFGFLGQLTTEVAGLGGNIGFCKNELLLQKNIPLFSDFVLQGTVSSGWMIPFKDENIKVCDNFFLGGPLSLRGFQIRGIGPTSDQTFFGAKTYWAGALHLYTPLPFRPGCGGFGELFRTHFFVNAGNIGDWGDQANSLKELGDKIVQDTRLVTGVGIALRLGQMARVELNYCFPVWFQDSDNVVKGVQFGIGVQFL